MKFYLYVHSNRINGKKYVGVTRQRPEKRWLNGNGYSRQKKFYNAILKYGWDNFDHQVWELGSEKDMYYGEKYLILFYDTIHNGYNVSTGGDGGTTGTIMSDETKQKISEAKKGVSRGPLSEEWKHNLSLSTKGQPRGPMLDETKKKLSDAHIGKRHTEETRKKMSDSRKKRAKVVLQIKDGIVIAEYANANEAAMALNKQFADGIWKAIRNNKTYLNYEWKYK